MVFVGVDRIGWLHQSIRHDHRIECRQDGTLTLVESSKIKPGRSGFVHPLDNGGAEFSQRLTGRHPFADHRIDDFSSELLNLVHGQPTALPNQSFHAAIGSSARGAQDRVDVEDLASAHGFIASGLA